MANKNRKIFGFFAKKVYFDVPHAIRVLGRTSVEPITPGPFRRDRLLGAVAQWRLRLFFSLSNIAWVSIKTLIGGIRDKVRPLELC